jgi:hypothetical protein
MKQRMGNGSICALTIIINAAIIATLTCLLSTGARAQNVVTYHGDALRTGWFSAETQLTVNNVNAQSFGLLETVTLDGRVDAEPLYVSNVTFAGHKGTHNVIYVVTENDTVYWIDADTGKILGHRHFGTPVPYEYKNYDDNVYPVMGILGTPVIDINTGIMYLVTDTYNGKQDAFRLHAISITTAKDIVPAVAIKISARLADGTTWKFNPKYHLQRPGLLEANGSIYVAFGSNGDTQPDQSRGSIARYDATTLAFLGSDVTNTSIQSPAYYLSSVWQSGFGIAADSNGDIYFSTGNSDPYTPSYSSGFNRPDSVVHLSGDLTSLLDSFTPSDYFQLDQGDTDLGSGGAMLLPDQTGSIPHFVIAGGKDGRAFLLNRDNLGGYTPNGPDNVLQTVNQGGCWCGPAYFVGADGNPYVLTGGGNGITSWQLSFPSGQLVQKSSAGSGATDGLPDYGGAIPVVSSNGTVAGTAIAWWIQRPSSSSDSNPGTPVTLQAFDASNLQHQLISIPAGTWTHADNSNADLVPTVANGKVYVASNEQLQIFGLLPSGARANAAPVQAIAASKPDVVACPPSEPVAAAFGASAQASGVGSKHAFTGTVCRIDGNQIQLALRSGHSITVDASSAFANHRQIVLSLGRVIHARGRIDAQGALHAERISPSHTLSPLTPADR